MIHAGRAALQHTRGTEISCMVSLKAVLLRPCIRQCMRCSTRLRCQHEQLELRQRQLALLCDCGGNVVQHTGSATAPRVCRRCDVEQGQAGAAWVIGDGDSKRQECCPSYAGDELLLVLPAVSACGQSQLLHSAGCTEIGATASIWILWCRQAAAAAAVAAAAGRVHAAANAR